MIQSGLCKLISIVLDAGYINKTVQEGFLN